MPLKFSLFLLVFCLPVLLVAQPRQYNFSRLDSYSGLSNNQVNSLFRDPQGFLWIGTVSGLNRYDGHTIKLFRNKQSDTSSIVDNNVTALYELPDQQIWVMTRRVPCIYNSKTEQFNPTSDTWLTEHNLPVDSVIRIIRGKHDRFWFLFHKAGLYEYTSGNNKSRLIHITAGPENSYKITDVKESEDAQLWMIYQHGLLEKRDVLTGSILYSTNSISVGNAGLYDYRIHIDHRHQPWLFTANVPLGLFTIHTGSNQLQKINEGTSPVRLNNNLITGLIEDENGLLWVATDHGGVNLIDPVKKTIRYLINDPANAKSISQNSILAIHRDAEGIIWLGSFKQGVSSFNPSIEQFQHLHHQEGSSESLPFDDVNRFVEDASGNIWIGTNGGGLIYYNRKLNSFRQYLHDPGNLNSLSNNVVVSLAMDQSNNLWIGSYFGGLSSFDGKRFIHYRKNEKKPESLSDDRVWEIIEDPSGRLWIGTLSGGLNLFDQTTGIFRHFKKDGTKPELIDNYISSMLVDRQGILWVGTALGITRLSKNLDSSRHLQHNATDSQSLSNNNVISLLEDRTGRIWAGTSDGLNLYQPATNDFIRYSTNQGLPDNTILTITEDRSGALWITSPNGLCKLKTDSLNRLDITVTTYDGANNLQGKEFNENAALLTRNGEVIVGGPGGFNIIDPGRINFSSQPAPVLLTELQILNEPVQVGQLINGKKLLNEVLTNLKQLELSYQENVFSLEFVSLDFSGTVNRYAYQLEGFTKEWLYTDALQRRVTYTNLDPGTYYFNVKAGNNKGQWSSVKTMKIIISPPWWKTTIAFILYALVIIGALWLARRILLDRASMRFAVQQQKREADRMQAIDRMKTKFFTNVSHEFRTPLSLILAPLDKIIQQAAQPEQKKQLHLVQRNAKRLLNLVNQLLDFRKMEVEELRLHPSFGDIVEFVRDISYSFSDIAEKKSIQFQLISETEHLEIYFDRDKMEKILFNLLSNAYKYTPDHGQVSVKLSHQYTETSGEITISVLDTGIGIPADQQERIFERFFQSEMPDDMANQGTGIGLAITREFVKLHQGTITVSSQPERGTCFTVSIPIKKFQPPPPTELTMESEPMHPEDSALLQDVTVSRARGKKTILIVEDNDDIRFYLKDNLQPSYHVLEAVNGEQGWEMVKSRHPDLVVSDIMMPKLNGLELARLIKSQTPTAHIPIILLTAMGSEEKKLEGYQIGVNDYITKPFTFEILASRIRNLLDQQKLLQRRFQKQVDVQPSEVTITPLDEAFLRQAISVVERQIDEPAFSVEEFSKEMNMSRVGLYKKLLSLTGKPPLEFIRSIRLKRGAQLLASGKNVSEIAYEVGFNNPKLFTSYFKEEFGVLPSKFKQTDT